MKLKEKLIIHDSLELTFSHFSIKLSFYFLKLPFEFNLADVSMNDMLFCLANFKASSYLTCLSFAATVLKWAKDHQSILNFRSIYIRPIIKVTTVSIENNNQKINFIYLSLILYQPRNRPHSYNLNFALHHYTNPVCLRTMYDLLYRKLIGRPLYYGSMISQLT